MQIRPSSDAISPGDRQVWQSLQASEEQFQTLVANIPGAVYRYACHPEGKIEFLSDAIAEISGYPVDEFASDRRSFSSIVHPQDRDRVRRHASECLDRRSPYDIEYRLVRSDGRVRWVRDRGRGVFRDDRPVYLDGVIFDITDRKRTETQLRSTQRFLDCLIENLPLSVTIQDAKTLEFTYWNQASEELFGYDKSEVLGKSDYAWLNATEARSQRVRDRQILAGGELVEIPEVAVETPHRGRRWLHVKQVPLRDEDEAEMPQYLLAICEDITERKQTEAALQHSERHYRRIVETASEGVWMFDAESKTTFANARMAEMLGYSPEQMQGRSLFDFMDEEGRRVYESYLQRRRQGLPERHDFRFRRRDGSDLWAIVSATPILDDGGEFIGVLRMITDISDRKQAEIEIRQSKSRLKAKNEQLKQTLGKLKRTQAQLVQSEKMVSLGQLVAGVAHEINNPTSFIYGNVEHAEHYIQELVELLELYRQHYPNPDPEIEALSEDIDLDFLLEDLPKLLGSMKSGADRIHQIVLSLRNFSRHDEAERKPVDLHEGIESTLTILQHRLKATGRRLEIEVVREYGQLPRLDCYAGQLNQVFMNLLANAIDALEDRERPQIRIRTECRGGDRVAISIGDNGAGMNPEVLRRSFDPFFTTKPVGKGTGMGLFVVHQIVVEQHGGRIDCHSKPGEGARFEIELPIAASA